MGKSVLIICMIIAGSFFNQVSAQKKIIKWLSLIPTFEMKFGQNTIIQGKLCKCCNSGLCSITVGRMPSNSPKEFRDVVLESPTIVIDDEGNLYVAVNDGFDREEFYNSVEIYTETTIDEESLLNLNEAIKSVNPDATEFMGIRKGTVLEPFQQDHLRLIKIN